MKMNPVVHFEMPAEDRRRMAEFYTKTFGWRINQLGEEMGNYVVVHTTETDENNMVQTPGAVNGGFFQKIINTPRLSFRLMIFEKQRKKWKRWWTGSWRILQAG